MLICCTYSDGQIKLQDDGIRSRIWSLCADIEFLENAQIVWSSIVKYSYFRLFVGIRWNTAKYTLFCSFEELFGRIVLELF